MNEIEYTLKVKVTTDTPIDELAVRAIGTAITEGAEANLDTESSMETMEMSATFLTPTTIDCFEKVEEHTEKTDEDGVYLP